MEQTLYGDILFLVNFTMDFLTLYITAAILRRKARTLRLCLASALGGVYGVAACFMSCPLIINIAVNLAISYLMCKTAFGRRVLPCYALFYGSGCLLGGAMTAFFTFMNGMTGSNNVSMGGGSTLPGKIPLGWMAVSALMIGGAAIAGGRMAKRKRSLCECRIAVVTPTGSFVFDGITDSGNLLTDPMSGKPVIIIGKEKFLSMLPSTLVPFYEKGDASALSEVKSEYLSSVRLIPSVSVGGERLLLSYIPKKISINGTEVSSVIAMGDESYGGHTALVPEILTS